MAVNLQYSDDLDSGNAKDPAPMEAKIRRILWGKDDSSGNFDDLKPMLHETDIDDAFRRSTFGNIRFPEEVGQIISVNLQGSVNETSNSVCTGNGLAEMLSPYLVSAGVHVQHFDFVQVFAPSKVAHVCNSGGWGTLGSSSVYSQRALFSACFGLDAYSTSQMSSLARTSAHELGHNLGFMHSYANVHSSPAVNEYGDGTCTMGGGLDGESALTWNSAKMVRNPIAMRAKWQQACSYRRYSIDTTDTIPPIMFTLTP